MTGQFAETLDEVTGGTISQARQREQQQAQEQAQRQQNQNKTVGESVAPLFDAEKGDIEFWLLVTQTVLLLIIARELRSGG